MGKGIRKGMGTKNLKNSIQFFLIFIAGFTSCDTAEDPIICTPVRITRTIAQGTDATSVTEDYRYLDGRLDRIIRSDYQTYYYQYDDSGRVDLISRVNVRTYEKRESRMIYEHGKRIRSDEYRIRLDQFTQQDADTSFTGYRSFSYDGNTFLREIVYHMLDSINNPVPVQDKTYEYDGSGNLLSYVCMDMSSGDTLEAFNYIYDIYSNPFSYLGLPFEGETFVNNIVQSTDLLQNEVYNYQLLYAPTRYPEQINIKQESYLVEVIRIEYTCD